MLHLRARRYPLAFDATIRITAMLERSGYWEQQTQRYGKRLPRPLADFHDRVKAGKRKRPSHKGKHSDHEYYRNIAICDLLQRVCELGPKMTKNVEAQHANSACDVVADAMIAHRLQPQTYDHLKDIWEHYQQRFMETDPKNYLFDKK